MLLLFLHLSGLHLLFQLHLLPLDPVFVFSSVFLVNKDSASRFRLLVRRPSDVMEEDVQLSRVYTVITDLMKLHAARCVMSRCRVGLKERRWRTFVSV